MGVGPKNLLSQSVPEKGPSAEPTQKTSFKEKRSMWGLNKTQEYLNLKRKKIKQTLKERPRKKTLGGN